MSDRLPPPAPPMLGRFIPEKREPRKSSPEDDDPSDPPRGIEIAGRADLVA